LEVDVLEEMVLRRARSLWNQLIDYYRPIPNPIDYEVCFIFFFLN